MLETLLHKLGRGRAGGGDLPPPAYTLLWPATMLWSNHQRPHHILTQLARHYDVQAVFNDWTLSERRLENGRLIVTKGAHRARFHDGPLVYYFSIPDKLDYLRRYRLDPDLVVFELMDLPTREFEGWQERLPEALGAADIIRTTNPEITDYLHQEHAGLLEGKFVATSRNGVDLDLFDDRLHYDVPPDVNDVPRPILGFYGNLDWWIDWELMDRLARLEGYQVVVIGDTEGAKDRIPERLRNGPIRWLGRKPVDHLPAYLDQFAVALFPFVVNEMTDAVDPLKVWEYFAFGRPVIAAPTRFVRERAELFEVVDGRPLEAVVQAAIESGEDEEAGARRKAAAAERDWRLIAGEMHEEIIGALGK